MGTGNKLADRSERAATVKRLAEANPHLRVFDTGDARLGAYGREISLAAPELNALLDAAEANVPSQPGSVTYVAAVPELAQGSWVAPIRRLFGGIDLQFGWCASGNSTLNGLEYHASPELVLALTDLVLLLGKPADIDKTFHYDSSRVECLYLARGQAVLLNPGILHFSPCRVYDAPFRSLIVLPAGTNTPLEADSLPAKDAAAVDEQRLLFMKNKWLLAHPRREPLMQRGAWPGIDGDNVEVRILET